MRRDHGWLDELLGGQQSAAGREHGHNHRRAHYGKTFPGICDLRYVHGHARPGRRLPPRGRRALAARSRRCGWRDDVRFIHGRVDGLLGRKQVYVVVRSYGQGHRRGKPPYLTCNVAVRFRLQNVARGFRRQAEEESTRSFLAEADSCRLLRLRAGSRIRVAEAAGGGDQWR